MCHKHALPFRHNGVSLRSKRRRLSIHVDMCVTHSLWRNFTMRQPASVASATGYIAGANLSNWISCCECHCNKYAWEIFGTGAGRGAVAGIPMRSEEPTKQPWRQIAWVLCSLMQPAPPQLQHKLTQPTPPQIRLTQPELKQTRLMHPAISVIDSVI